MSLIASLRLCSNLLGSRSLSFHAGMGQMSGGSYVARCVEFHAQFRQIGFSKQIMQLPVRCCTSLPRSFWRQFRLNRTKLATFSAESSVVSLTDARLSFFDYLPVAWSSLSFATFL